MKRFNAKKTANGVEVVLVNQMSIEQAKQRKTQLEANIRTYQHQIEQIESLKTLAEEELQEIIAVLGDKPVTP